jgi:hypothetical protein
MGYPFMNTAQAFKSRAAGALKCLNACSSFPGLFRLRRRRLHGAGAPPRVWAVPCTPAMAAGLTDQVWTLREVMLFRVPPWPQPQEL